MINFSRLFQEFIKELALRFFKNSTAICSFDKFPKKKLKNSKETAICALTFIFLHIIFSIFQIFRSEFF